MYSTVFNSRPVTPSAALFNLRLHYIKNTFGTTWICRNLKTGMSLFSRDASWFVVILRDLPWFFDSWFGLAVILRDLSWFFRNSKHCYVDVICRDSFETRSTVMSTLFVVILRDLSWFFDSWFGLAVIRRYLSMKPSKVFR